MKFIDYKFKAVYSELFVRAKISSFKAFTFLISLNKTKQLMI